MDDIVPGLLQEIQSQFDERTYNSDKLKKALQSYSFLTKSAKLKLPLIAFTLGFAIVSLQNRLNLNIHG